MTATVWTDAHFATLRTFIAAAKPEELEDANFLVGEAQRAALPLSNPASLMHAINNACRNTPEWDAARRAMLTLARFRGRMKVAAKAKAKAKAEATPTPSSKVKVAAKVARGTKATAEAEAEATTPDTFNGKAIHSTPPVGYLASAFVAEKIGRETTIKSNEIPSFMRYVYVRSRGPKPYLYLLAFDVARWMRQRKTAGDAWFDVATGEKHAATAFRPGSKPGPKAATSEKPAAVKPVKPAAVKPVKPAATSAKPAPAASPIIDEGVSGAVVTLLKAGAITVETAVKLLADAKPKG